MNQYKSYLTEESAYISFGANQGDCLQTFHSVLLAFQKNDDIQYVRHSTLYQTAPVGGPPQPDSLTAIVQLKTSLSPMALLQFLQQLEWQLGRDRENSERWGPRTVDLDLLLFGQQVVSESLPVELSVPHPRLHLRRFVLIPFAELSPQANHPLFTRTIQELLHSCPDTSSVLPYKTKHETKN